MTFRADLKPNAIVQALERLRAQWVLTALAGLGLIAFFIGWGWAFRDIPGPPGSASALWEVRRESSISVRAADGSSLGVRGPRYARPVTLDQLPDYVPQAFIAIEDQSFYDHRGVDWRAMARAMAANIRAGGVVQGGSTLTMQLVKNLILTPDQTIRRKLQELRLALELEQNLSKNEILELYLNRIYLGDGAYGIEAAAQRYFDKPASDLTLSEAALLAALPKAPTRLAPTANLAAAQARAEIVLQAMLETRALDPIAYLTGLTSPAELAEGAGRDVNSPVFGHIFDYAEAEARDILGDTAPPILVIETTINPALQEAAHAALNAKLDQVGTSRSIGEGAIVVMDLNGQIQAMVGGRDYAQSQFNRASQALRQPGSAFKPIVFAAGFEAGLDPGTAYQDAPIDIEGWQPENYGGGYRGRITIADALKRSINTVAAQVGAEIGIDPIAELGAELGITTPLNRVPALSLGTSEVRLIEMTSVYAGFANQGQRTDPVLVTGIRNARGDLLWGAPEASPDTPAMDSETATSISRLLESVVLDGTGRRAQLPNRRAAGKTGTSQNNRDAWFIGYTGQLAAGVWLGNDDDTAMNEVTGGSVPAEIWRSVMIEAHRGLEPIPLSSPPPIRRTEREESVAAFYSSLSARFEDIISGSDS